MLELTVADDGPGIAVDAAFPPGHAISNTRERLRALYGDRASLHVRPSPTGGSVATIRLPYREVPEDRDAR